MQTVEREYSSLIRYNNKSESSESMAVFYVFRIIFVNQLFVTVRNDMVVVVRN